MRARIIVIGVVVLAVAIIVGGIVFFATRFPGVARQSPLNAAPVLVNLTVPLDGAQVPLNESTSVQAQALGDQPIATLELWADGALVQTTKAQKPDQKQLFALWGWTPSSEGDHTLVARATDAQHRVVSSNVVQVTASTNADSTITLNYQAQPGDTSASIAQKFGVTPQQIVDQNPQVDPSGQIPPGQIVNIPTPVGQKKAGGAPQSKTRSPTKTPTPTPTHAPPISTPTVSGATLPNFHFKSALLNVTSPMDKAYCYLSINGGEWSRLPPAPDTFAYPSKGVFDVSPFLHSLSIQPQQGGATAALDCWGWKGATLVYLGKATQTISPGQTNVQIAGDKFKFVGNLLGSNPIPFGPPPGPIPFIYPAVNVHDTANPNDCANHTDTPAIAGLLCASAIEQKYLILVWDRSLNDKYVDPNNPQRQYQVIVDIDGFHVYENDLYYQHQLANTTSAGPNNNVSMSPLLPLPPCGPIGCVQFNRCFVVRAYKGGLESADSNTFCPNLENLGTRIVPIQPTIARSIYHQHHLGLNICPFIDRAVTGVGYGHYNDQAGPFGTDECQQAVRTLVWFDLTSAGLGPIWNATLKFHKDNTYYSYSDEDGALAYSNANYYSSCARELLLPTTDWIKQGVGPWDGDPEQAPPVTDFPTQDYAALANLAPNQDYTVDVTDLVRQWQNSGNNYGFALRGSDEYTSEEDNNTCMSTYSNFVLQVTTFK